MGPRSRSSWQAARAPGDTTWPSGADLEEFGRSELLDVIDISAFVAELRAALASGDLNALMPPSEDVYRPENRDLAERLMLHIPG